LYFTFASGLPRCLAERPGYDCSTQSLDEIAEEPIPPPARAANATTTPSMTTLIAEKIRTLRNVRRSAGVRAAARCFGACTGRRGGGGVLAFFAKSVRW